MAIIRERTPLQKVGYIALAIAVLLAVAWFVVYTPIGRLLKAD